jgi:hypothetical protein
MKRQFDLMVSLMAVALLMLCAGPVQAQNAKAAPFQIVEATIDDIHMAFRSGRLTARELVQGYLDRINAYDKQGPNINSIITINPNALAEADRLDAAFRASGLVGPLHGITILVKDEIDTVGMPTTLGTVVFKDYRPPKDAFVIDKLRKAGAIILGKTTLSEFAAGDTSLWKRLGGKEHKEHGERLADQAEEHYAHCREAYGTLMGRIATAIVSVFSAELDGLLSEYEAFKRRAAVLDFDDLLFTCRDVLRTYPPVRQAAAGRYSRMLVDEFQDTDPVQAEIIFLLSTEEGPEIWHKRRLMPGHLFLVGDPKQAIYRFRGADLATYLLVRQAIEAQFPNNILHVTANFRSRTQILDHVNLCFEEKLSAQQAGYVALRSTRAAADHGSPCVAKVTIDLPPNTWLDSTRDEEARKVAEICARLIGNVEVRPGRSGDQTRLAHRPRPTAGLSKPPGRCRRGHG